MNTSSNYKLLIEKLDSFIRKYYVNQIIRGILYTVGAVIMLFILVSILEHFFYFNKGIRKVLFFGFLGSTLTMLYFWVFDPIRKYFHLGKTISHEQAASIIGNHFYDVKDKLINVLQLKKQADGIDDRSLIEASINQKSAEIKPIPFQSAIDLGKNKQYLRYALPPFLLLLILVFAAPSMIKDSTHRLIHNNKEFEKAAPFSFVLQNDQLQAVQYSDHKIEVNTQGDVLPKEAFIEVNDFQYRLHKKRNGAFTYTFKNVQKDTPFRLFSGEVKSDEQELKVLVKPSLSNLVIDFDYPSYTGRKDESVSNTGDMIVPEGTKVRWNVNTVNTEEVTFAFSQDLPEGAKRQGESFFYFDKRIRQNDLYKIFYSNADIPFPDSVRYSINVIKDQFPSIAVEQYQDSIENTILFFVGNAADDYGLKELTFNYRIVDEKGSQKATLSTPLESPRGRSVDYNYVLDILDLNLAPGDKLTYYFEVKDNDAVNGSKSAKTGIMTYAKPSLAEIEKMENVNEEQIKEDLLKSLEESEKIQEELQKLRDKLLQKEKLEWQDKKELEKLLEKQKELNEKLQDAKEKFDQNQENREEFNPQNEDLQEKQEKLEEIFEKVMDPERQELMEKIQELIQELQKEDMIQMMDEMQMAEQTKEKEMERLLNLYKQLEMEKEITEMSQKLDEIAEKQAELAEQTEEQAQKSSDQNPESKEAAGEEQKEEENSESQDEMSQEEMMAEQEKLNQEMEEMMEKMKEIEKQNEELNPPKNLDSENQEKMEDIKQDMERSLEEMQQQQNSKSAKSQKNAAQKMKNMASQMMSSMESGEMEQIQEDMAALRQLLENLVTLSFDQETLIKSLRITKTVTPRYVELVQEQFKIKNDFQMIDDSLTALSTRVDQIASFVTEKVSEIKRNMDTGLKYLEERQVPEANESQRFTMKNVNDLALMLDESMQQMQQQMSSMMAGSQMCSKPNGENPGQKGKVPMDKITQGQEGVGQKLREMSQQEGKGKDGLSAKDFAEAAARQAALRKALEEMKQSKEEQGKGAQGLQEIIDEMDKIEIDLVNKKLDNELMLRQQEILTRLLKAEKAEQQQEYDNKRKAEQAREKRKELPLALQEYLKKREAEIEMYKTVSPDLRPYYKSLVDEYYRALKQEK